MKTNDKQFLAQKIRSQYVEREESELDELRALDKKAKKGATIFSYIFGSIGAIVMGGGMSLVMTDIGASLGVFAIVLGVLIGIVGIVLVSFAYPIYNYITKVEREKVAPEILRLTEELMK